MSLTVSAFRSQSEFEDKSTTKPSTIPDKAHTTTRQHSMFDRTTNPVKRDSQDVLLFKNTENGKVGKVYESLHFGGASSSIVF